MLIMYIIQFDVDHAGLDIDIWHELWKSKHDEILMFTYLKIDIDAYVLHTCT